MRVRGQRECKECGREWSYYHTGSIACPACGSVHSVGREERRRHTDTPIELDLSPALAQLDAGSLDDGEIDDSGFDDIAPEVTSTLREYVRKRGFIEAGELRRLDDRFLLAHELIQALDVYARLREPDDAAEYYVVSLLGGVEDGRRPPPDDVPPALWAARGVGYAEAIAAYRQDLSTWLDDHPDKVGRQVLGELEQQRKRVAALQGDIDPTIVEQLVTIARELGAALESDSEGSLGGARERLERLSRSLE